ncbi:hypothetical protein QUH28_28165, partial [Klebsiella pneumoniae]|nr:hypothetical protein [Klebsiella pneumoniae]
YLFNDVENIQKAADKLAELVPEARIAIGHGQMRERELERVMNTRNNGAIHGLDDDAVVETNSIIDAQGARPLAFGPLPPAMNG